MEPTIEDKIRELISHCRKELENMTYQSEEKRKQIAILSELIKQKQEEINRLKILIDDIT